MALKKVYEHLESDLKGVVDNLNDAVEIFNAHIRTQRVENPSKYLSFTFVLYFAKMRKYYDYVLILFKKPPSLKSLWLLDYYR